MAVQAILPIACAWAKWHERTILQRGEALPAAQMQTAKRMGIVHPERVRLLAVSVIPPKHWLLRRLGAKFGFVSSRTIGMTLRYGIFIRADCRGDRRLLVHELAHVLQYERLGGFRGFLGQYLQECISPGYPWGDLEREAKRAEAEHN